MTDDPPSVSVSLLAGWPIPSSPASTRRTSSSSPPARTATRSSAAPSSKLRRRGTPHNEDDSKHDDDDGLQPHDQDDDDRNGRLSEGEGAEGGRGGSFRRLPRPPPPSVLSLLVGLYRINISDILQLPFALGEELQQEKKKSFLRELQATTHSIWIAEHTLKKKSKQGRRVQNLHRSLSSISPTKSSQPNSTCCLSNRCRGPGRKNNLAGALLISFPPSPSPICVFQGLLTTSESIYYY